MPNQLFSDTINPAKYAVGSKKWYTLPLSIAVHTVGLGAIVVIPLLVTNVLLPSPERLMTFVVASAVPVPEPPAVRIRKPDILLPREINPGAAPVVASEKTMPEPTLPVVNAGVTTPGQFLTATLTGPVHIPTPPPEAAPERVRVGGSILAPRKIKDVTPIYPAVARAATMSGVVLIEAVIGRDGRVADARVLRSVPLLDNAALDAVRQWRYTPTMLNGQAVDVVLTVAVNFAIE